MKFCSSRGRNVFGKYSGWAGSPVRLILRQYISGISFRTAFPRPACKPWFPQAAITMSEAFAHCLIHASFLGPTGSSTFDKIVGSVARYANRFTIVNPPYPHDSVNSRHRRSVGSSRLSSAVEGFKPMNRAVVPEGIHLLQTL